MINYDFDVTNKEELSRIIWELSLRVKELEEKLNMEEKEDDDR